jgi:proteasome assembly chaperone (PAC2) family protein
VGSGTLQYLVRKFPARPLASFGPGDFYLYQSDRPTVTVEGGRVKALTWVSNTCYFWINEEGDRDVILFQGQEPHVMWSAYTDILMDLCQRFGVELVITLGGTQDSVLHEDEKISFLVSDEGCADRTKGLGLEPVDYEGPTAIQSVLLWEAKKRSLSCIGLWGHVPYYIQGANFKVYSRMVRVLGALGGFDLNTGELDLAWVQVKAQVEGLIDKNPELKRYTEKLKKGKRPAAGMSDFSGKVIRLDEFMKSKE